MARERKPYRRTVRGKEIGWYILWEGRQTWVGRFEKEAIDNWKRLKDGKPVIRPDRTTKADNEEPTVRYVVDAFLDHHQVKAAGKGSKETYLWYRRFLKSFCEHDGNGKLRVTKLNNMRVQSWINANVMKSVGKHCKPWSDNTAHAAGRAVTAAFNHAVKMGLLEKSPLRGFEKATPTPREDCELTPGEWKRVLDAVDDPAFRDAIVFMRLTGARPMECRNAEKRHFHSEIPAIIFPKSEAKGKKTERVIRLTGEALLIVQKLAMRYPEGNLFRNGNGTPWTKDAFARRFTRLGERLGITQLIPYSMRHTFATDAVANGVDSIVLAKLMGHTSTKMLERVYAKHERRNSFMNEQAAKAVEGIG